MVNERAIGYALGLWLWWQSRLAGAAVLDSDMAVLDPPGGYSAKVLAFARAVARAEGFGVAGAVPTRLNNPGDLKASSVASIGRDASGHLQFANLVDGWTALYRQVQLIIDGHSRNYTLDMTINEMAAKYAESNVHWARNVAGALNVPASTRLREILL